jgi:hypothetical protein
MDAMINPTTKDIFVSIFGRLFMRKPKNKQKNYKIRERVLSKIPLSGGSYPHFLRIPPIKTPIRNFHLRSSLADSLQR